MSMTLLIDDAIVSAQALFSPLGKCITCPGKSIAQRADRADALIIRSRTQIDEALLAQHPQIRFIGSSVVGLDHVDQAACMQHGVAFYSAQGCNARSVAEYVLTHLVEYVAERKTSFTDVTLGIIGVGHVGQQVQAMAEGLGIRCLLNDPFRAEAEPAFVHTSLPQLLAEADVITLHTPLTTTGRYPSYHLLNADNLQHLKTGCLLINAARGGVVDELALLARQDIHWVIDCWENEPYPHPELFARARAATPHIAGHAIDAKYRGGWMVAKALADWLGTPELAPAFRLPTSDLPELVIPNAFAAQPIQALASLLKQSYDFAQDRQALAEVVHQGKREAMGQAFEAYRRYYPARYEWTHLNITGEVHPQLAAWLVSLGISVSQAT